jgi:two-component system cell cycle sensor histidine kinase/response regulator CckA
MTVKPIDEEANLETMGLMARGLAHKLNNLMTIIISNSNFLLEELGPENPLRKDVETIKQAGRRGSDLIRHMTILSQKKAPQPEATDLNLLIQDLDQTLRQITGVSVDLKISLDPDLKKAMIDPSQLEDMIMSIAMNAKDAMPEGGSLMIETANVILDEERTGQWQACKPGPYVMLVISDIGMGMDTHTLSRIFDPFFTTKDDKKNTGLGLFAIRHTLKQINGWIEVYSEPNKGTNVNLYLPVT